MGVSLGSYLAHELLGCTFQVCEPCSCLVSRPKKEPGDGDRDNQWFIEQRILHAKNKGSWNNTPLGKRAGHGSNLCINRPFKYQLDFLSLWTWSRGPQWLVVLCWTRTWWSRVDDERVKEGKRLIFPGLRSWLLHSRESTRNRERERKKERQTRGPKLWWSKGVLINMVWAYILSYKVVILSGGND